MPSSTMAPMACTPSNWAMALPIPAPTARDGANRPPGMPDRVEASVAMNFNGAKLQLMAWPSTAARAAVEGHAMSWSFAPLKFMATLASTLSGIPGGLFAPSLAVGAGMGSAIAQLLGVHAIGAIVLLGMCSYFSGAVQAPITAAVLIGEMTAASGMRLPLLLAAMIAYGVSRLIQRESLYHALAENFLKA